MSRKKIGKCENLVHTDRCDWHVRASNGVPDLNVDSRGGTWESRPVDSSQLHPDPNHINSLYAHMYLERRQHLLLTSFHIVKNSAYEID